MGAAGGGGGASELTVLGAWASPFLVRVRVVLHLKGLGYEYVETRFFLPAAIFYQGAVVNPVTAGNRKIPNEKIQMNFEIQTKFIKFDEIRSNLHKFR